MHAYGVRHLFSIRSVRRSLIDSCVLTLGLILAISTIPDPIFATDIYDNVSPNTQLASELLDHNTRNGAIWENPDDGDDYRELFVTFGDRGALAFAGVYSVVNRPNFNPIPIVAVWGDPAPPSGTLGIVFADVNNDGLIEFVAPHPSGLKLYSYAATGQFVDVTDEYGLAGLNAASASWGDYDGDSYIDLFLVRDTSTVQLLHNNAGAGFTDLGNNVGFAPNVDGIRSGLWADFDQDNDVDLILVQGYGETGPTSVYYDNRIDDQDPPALIDVTSTKMSSILSDLNFGYGFASCADFNNDGLADFLYYNPRRLGVASSDAAGMLTSYWRAEYTVDLPRFSDISVFDADNDGFVDMLATMDYPNTIKPFLRLGDGIDLADKDQEFDGWPSAEGACVGDFTGDGYREIFLTRDVSASQDYAFFYDIYNGDPNVPGPNWVGFTFDIPDGLCNRLAIGATVIVSSSDPNDDFIQARVVDGGSGGCSQNDLMMSVGLGAYSGNVDVKVILPNRGVAEGGTTLEYFDLPTGQYHTIEASQLISPNITTTISHNAATGKITLDVSWTTPIAMDPAQDMVTFIDGGADALVPDPLRYYNSGQGGDTTSHNMVISGLPCSAGKSFYLKVQSAKDTQSMVSSVISVYIKKCLVPGDPPDPHAP